MENHPVLCLKSDHKVPEALGDRYALSIPDLEVEKPRPEGRTGLKSHREECRSQDLSWTFLIQSQTDTWGQQEWEGVAIALRRGGQWTPWPLCLKMGLRSQIERLLAFGIV